MNQKQKKEIEENFKRDLEKIEKIIIVWNKGTPTNTGRSDYYTIIGFDKDFYKYNLEYYISKLSGYRLNKADQLIITGMGFSKTDVIREFITKYAKNQIEYAI